MAHNTPDGQIESADTNIDRASVVMHIPHASTHLPSLEGFVLDAILPNMALQTDWATDAMFDVEGVKQIVTPFSRLFCDVERLRDEDEPQFKSGRGFYYTLGFDGSLLRHEDANHKRHVHKEYYTAHHTLLDETVHSALAATGKCCIIDCHSFNDQVVGTLCDTPHDPDFCIGTDGYHTPDALRDYAVDFFKSRGYTVEIDNPFSGCVIPMSVYQSNPNVTGLMIEVNKRLYMVDLRILRDQVGQLQRVMSDFVYGMPVI
ncbi:MAG: N-formylglutamate amidohydrolase [Candidatus Kapabacteria bacterium]|nr:N-formylglutamate amidohydrolase [Candidatus Kapabacteria bacterium]